MSTRHSHDFRANFIEQRNGLAADEIQAHIGMFEAATNDGYYEMGLKAARAVREALESWERRQATGDTHVNQKANQSADDSLVLLDEDIGVQNTEAKKQPDHRTDPHTTLPISEDDGDKQEGTAHLLSQLVKSAPGDTEGGEPSDTGGLLL